MFTLRGVTEAIIYRDEPLETAMAQIHETVDMIEHIQPVYNFKVSEYNKPHWKK